MRMDVALGLRFLLDPPWFPQEPCSLSHTEGADRWAERCLAEQKDRPEERPVHRLAAWRVKYSVERIGILSRAILPEKRRVEHRIKQKGASLERRFRAELLQHELLDRIIENPETRPDAGLAGASKQFSKEAISRVGTPSQADTRRKRLVVSFCESLRYACIPGDNQSRWDDACS